MMLCCYVVMPLCRYVVMPYSYNAKHALPDLFSFFLKDRSMLFIF